MCTLCLVLSWYVGTYWVWLLRVEDRLSLRSGRCNSFIVDCSFLDSQQQCLTVGLSIQRGRLMDFSYASPFLQKKIERKRSRFTQTAI